MSRFLAVRALLLVSMAGMLLSGCIDAPPDSRALLADVSARADNGRSAIIEDAQPAEVLRAAAAVLTESGYHLTVSEPDAGILSADIRMAADTVSRRAKGIGRLLIAPLAPEMLPLPLAHSYTQRVSIAVQPADDDVRLVTVFREATLDASGAAIHHALTEDPRLYRAFFAQLRQALFRQKQEHI